MSITILTGDCLDILPTLDENSIDAIVTDPPYGLGCMGKAWDHTVPGVPFWEAMYRVLKPGGHILAFGGTRTFHRMAVAIEDAGFEMRDTLSWLYGTGFPKSMDVGKAIDKAAVNDAAREWDGWGTALKPAWEPIIMARKPLAKGHTVAANVQEYGTGAINVDACRIGTDGGTRAVDFNGPRGQGVYGKGEGSYRNDIEDIGKGRWPPNVAMDEGVAVQLDLMSGISTSSGGQASLGAFRNGDVYGKGKDIREQRNPGIGDTGGASRFMYVAKASRSERNKGLEGMEERAAGVHDDDGYRQPGERKANHTAPQPSANFHPTVKPVVLMRWLVRMVTPPGGIVLDPFAGSGSTGVACNDEGFDAILIEMNREYIPIIKGRTAQESQ